MKKGQVVGQVFIYIIAAAIFVLILLYGYRAVNEFVERGEQVALIEFQTELSKFVSAMEPTQDLKYQDFVVPKGTNKVCFIDRTKTADPNIQSVSAIIFDSWVTPGVDQNVFLLPLAETEITVGNIIPQKTPGDTTGWLCVEPAGGRINLQFEGTGRAVKISQKP